MEVSGQLQAPAALPPRNCRPVTIVREDEWAPEAVWTRWRRERLSAPGPGRPLRDYWTDTILRPKQVIYWPNFVTRSRKKWCRFKMFHARRWPSVLCSLHVPVILITLPTLRIKAEPVPDTKANARAGTETSLCVLSAWKWNLFERLVAQMQIQDKQLNDSKSRTNNIITTP
jgi:hypothetical protein